MLPNVCLFLFNTIIFLLATVSSLEGEQLLNNLQKEALFIPPSSLSDYVPIGKGECLSNGHWSQCAMARASEGGWYYWGVCVWITGYCTGCVWFDDGCVLCAWGML